MTKYLLYITKHQDKTQQAGVVLWPQGFHFSTTGLHGMLFANRRSNLECTATSLRM